MVDTHVQMGISNQLRAIDEGFRLVASFPEYRATPIIIGESDPEGCAACSVRTNPPNAYRNGTMYSSYTAAQIARTYDLAALHGVNLRGSLTWAFLFEDQPYFAGFRDLATNGLDKPVLNVFRMLGKMTGDRVRVESSAAVGLETIRDRGVRDTPDVGALASRADRAIAVLLWHYHDDDLAGPPATIALKIDGVPVSSATLAIDLIDADHSNAYDAWKRMGSPEPPSPAQYRELERIGGLQSSEAPRRVRVQNGAAELSLSLARQGVSLVRLTW